MIEHAHVLPCNHEVRRGAPGLIFVSSRPGAQAAPRWFAALYLKSPSAPGFRRRPPCRRYNRKLARSGAPFDLASLALDSGLHHMNDNTMLRTGGQILVD